MRGCHRDPRRVVARWAYPYATRSRTWKKSMLVLHTVADPPYEGSNSLAMSGSTTKSRAAPAKAVTVNNAATGTPALAVRSLGETT